jgi:hypothetical protein
MIPGLHGELAPRTVTEWINSSASMGAQGTYDVDMATSLEFTGEDRSKKTGTKQ